MSDLATPRLGRLSAYLDEAMGQRIASLSRDELISELLTVHRTVKVGEEAGEAIQALIGVTGANPRKGVNATEADLIWEHLDGALTHLGAIEHLTGNDGSSVQRLLDHIGLVADRLGVA